MEDKKRHGCLTAWLVLVISWNVGFLSLFTLGAFVLRHTDKAMPLHLAVVYGGLSWRTVGLPTGSPGVWCLAVAPSDDQTLICRNEFLVLLVQQGRGQHMDSLVQRTQYCFQHCCGPCGSEHSLCGVMG